ncbi:hypothetical protein CIRMBP1212_01395 [Enterococcus cecorum]|nr:hypothetical protein CIRMBP1212_01395 [Enterococcus cecorum]
MTQLQIIQIMITSLIILFNNVQMCYTRKNVGDNYL